MEQYPLKTWQVALLVALTMASGGCLAGNNANRAGSPDDSATAGSLRTENQELSETVRSQRLDIAKLQAQLEASSTREKLLQDELSATQSDLARVERQFVALDNRLDDNETKASAVAAIAEVELLVEKFLRDTQEDSTVVTDVVARLKESERQVSRGNFAAAVYYADRAMRLVNQIERSQALAQSDRTLRVVAVNKANVRKGPGGKHKVVDQLAFGVAVSEIGRSGDWCHIRSNDGKSGWVHKSLLR